MDFFRTLSRIEEQEGAGLPNVLSTHPDPGNRLERIAELAAEWSITRQSKQTGPAAYFTAVEGVVLREDPRNGFVRRQVFYHPELRFRFPLPRDFRLINQPAQVIMMEKQRRAIIGFTSTGESSLQSTSAKFLSQLQVHATGAADQGSTTFTIR